MVKPLAAPCLGALAAACALTCAPLAVAAQTYPQVPGPGGSYINPDANLIFVQACNSGLGGFVGSTYNGVECLMPGASGSGGGSGSAPVGYASFTPSQNASVATTATQIVAARTGAAGTGRGLFIIENIGTTPMYCGPTSSVTTSNGLLLPGILGASITIATTSAVYCIAASGTGAVSYAELY